jgi:chromatin segregation and condensation protein Rec8/ScpA/Scc1 (kleisin family)
MSQTLAARGEGRFFYPGNMLTSESLAASLSPLLETLEKLTYETKTIKEKIVTIEEEMKTVLGRLEKIGNSSFSALSKSRSRGDVVVMFLALLHLCRDQMISLEQESRFSDIMIGKKQTSSAQ